MGTLVTEVNNDPVISSYTSLLKVADEESFNHGQFVAQMVEACLLYDNAPDWEEDFKKDVIAGCLMLDIGKAYIPLGLQYKRSALTEDERTIIETHPVLGAIILRDSRVSEVTKNIVLMHHANADGTGYPTRDQRPLISEDYLDRIPNGIVVPDYIWFVAYADRFGAQMSPRPHRNGLAPRVAWKDMLKLIETGKLDYKYKPVFEKFLGEISMERVTNNDERKTA